MKRSRFTKKWRRNLISIRVGCSFKISIETLLKGKYESNEWRKRVRGNEGAGRRGALKSHSLVCSRQNRSTSIPDFRLPISLRKKKKRLFSRNGMNKNFGHRARDDVELDILKNPMERLSSIFMQIRCERWSIFFYLSSDALIVEEI